LASYEGSSKGTNGGEGVVEGAVSCYKSSVYASKGNKFDAMVIHFPGHRSRRTIPWKGGITRTLLTKVLTRLLTFSSPPIPSLISSRVPDEGVIASF
jgi:hypothetical protein